MFSKEVKIPRSEQKKKKKKRETHAPHYPAINSVKIKQAQAKNSLIVWPESAAGRGEGRRRERGRFSTPAYVCRHACVVLRDDDVERSPGLGARKPSAAAAQRDGRTTTSHFPLNIP